MIDLNKEAEEYAKSIHKNHVLKTFREYSKNDFIAGANSKFVKKQILQAQINLCNSALDWSNIQDETSEYIENKLKQLQQELKQLQDVDKNS